MQEFLECRLIVSQSRAGTQLLGKLLHRVSHDISKGKGSDRLKAPIQKEGADDRFQTAGMLLIRYRTPLGGNPKEEKIDAKESKLILQGLADGDWSKGFSATELTPMMVFGRLALTDKDGWKPGPFQNYEKEFPEAAKKWLKDNADSYAIKRFVEDTKKEK